MTLSDARMSFQPLKTYEPYLFTRGAGENTRIFVTDRTELTAISNRLKPWSMWHVR